jgi:hypothetical protein
VTASAQAREPASIEPVPSGYDDIEDAAPGGSPMPADASASFALRRHDAQWQIDARGVSRLDAARRLAEASGSSLHGPQEPLERARPLHLRWQGRSLSQAWAQVLGPELNYAIQCGHGRCRAWIVGTAPATAPTTAATGPTSAVPISPASTARRETDTASDDESRD